MTERADLPLRDALRIQYAASDFPPDGGLDATRWTMLAFGGVKVRLPNFGWRRRALPHHDIHHVLTGYPCTALGECQIAAWEFAAGRFPSVYSTLFCLPLVGLGALVIPRRSFAAFVRGRRSATLYARPLTNELLATRVQVLRERMLPRSQPAASIGDRAAYVGLVTLSLTVTALPIALVLALAFIRL